MCAGAELYFTSVQPKDAGVYICTCQDQRSTNRSHAEIVVTSVYGYHCHIKRKMFFLMLPVKEHQIYVSCGSINTDFYDGKKKDLGFVENLNWCLVLRSEIHLKYF